MAEDGRIASVRQFVAEFNRGDMGNLRRFVAPEFFTYKPRNDEPNATEVVSELVSDLKVAFPDLAITIEDLVTTADGLRGHATFTGTYRTPLWGAPATCKPVSRTVSFSLRPVNGAFAVNLDDVTPQVAVGLLRELDIVNPPDEMALPPHHPVAIPDFILRLAFTGQAGDKPCVHLDEIRITEPATDVCEPCVALGDIWPALRMCLVCGVVGCCDTAKNKHMKQHFETTGHPIFRSIRLAEGWIWCYVDNAFFDKRMLERYRASSRP